MHRRTVLGIALLIAAVALWLELRPAPPPPPLPSSPPVPVEPPPSRGQTYLRTVPGASIRLGPSAESPVVERLDPATSLALLERRPPWARVRHTLGGRTRSLGWVHLERDVGHEFVLLSGARPPVPVDPEVIDEARKLFGSDHRVGSCGPYSLHTDLKDGGLLSACRAVASQLEITYRERFGLHPVGEPEGAIVWFSRVEDFRAFLRATGAGPIGYAAHADPGRGYLALFGGERDPDRTLRTLLHELTHLVGYRALGENAPRWLAEGLSDAIGDTAGPEGIRPLRGLEGAGQEAGRLGNAASHRSLDELLELTEEEFDAATVSYDYEQSALLVRFLLLDRELSPAFRAFLGDLSRGRAYAPDLLLERLDIDAGELEHRFRSWLAEALSS